MGNIVVWEKFTVGYFNVKIVHGKIYLSLEVYNENFLTMNYFKPIYGQTFILLLTNLMDNYT